MILPGHEPITTTKDMFTETETPQVHIKAIVDGPADVHDGDADSEEELGDVYEPTKTFSTKRKGIPKVDCARSPHLQQRHKKLQQPRLSVPKSELAPTRSLSLSIERSLRVFSTNLSTSHVPRTLRTLCTMPAATLPSYRDRQL